MKKLFLFLFLGCVPAHAVNMGSGGGSDVSIGSTAGGDLTGTYPNPTVAKVTSASSVTVTNCLQINDQYGNVGADIKSGPCNNDETTANHVSLSTPMAPIGYIRVDNPSFNEGAPIEMPKGLDTFTKPKYIPLEPTDGVTIKWVKGSQGLLSLDATDFVVGTQSYKLSTAGNGLQTVMKWSSISPALNLYNMQFMVMMKVNGLSNANQGPFIYFSTVPSGSPSFVTCDLGHMAGAQTYKYLQEGEWTPVPLNPADCPATAAGVDWANVQFIQIAAYDAGVASATVTVHVNGIFAYPLPGQGIISVEQDNIDSTWFSSGAPTALKLGIPVLSNWTPENSGTAGKWITVAQATFTAKIYGRELGLHGGGTDFDSISTQAVSNLIVHDQTFMRRNSIGANRGGCIYPHGAFNQSIEDVARQNCDYARTIVDGTAAGYDYNNFPPPDPYRLKCYSVANSDTPLKLKNMVDTVKANKSWGCFLFHVIDKTAGTSDVSTTTLTYFMNYIATTGVTVATIPEVLRMPYQVQAVSSMTVTGNFDAGISTMVTVSPTLHVSTSQVIVTQEMLFTGGTLATAGTALGISTGTGKTGCAPGNCNINLNAAGQVFFSVPISSHQTSGTLSGTFTNTALGPCITGSTVSITLPISGGIQVNFHGSLSDGTLAATMIAGILVDGVFVNSETTAKGLIWAQEAVATDGTNMSFPVGVWNQAAGAHNICLTLSVSAGTGTIDSTNSIAAIEAYALP